MENHSSLHFYHHVRNLSRTSIIQQRLKLFNSINGDAFYPFSVWPEDFKLIFWKKPISDKDTSKLYLFLIGNGCSPNLISHWILTSQHWTSEKKSRKTRSTTGLSTQQSEQQIRHTLVLFDLHNDEWLYLNGQKERLTTDHINSLSIKFLKLQVIFLIINLLSKFLSCTFISLIFCKLHFCYTYVLFS